MNKPNDNALSVSARRAQVLALNRKCRPRPKVERAPSKLSGQSISLPVEVFQQKQTASVFRIIGAIAVCLAQAKNNRVSIRRLAGISGLCQQTVCSALRQQTVFQVQHKLGCGGNTITKSPAPLEHSARLPDAESPAPLEHSARHGVVLRARLASSNAFKNSSKKKELAREPIPIAEIRENLEAVAKARLPRLTEPPSTQTCVNFWRLMRTYHPDATVPDLGDAFFLLAKQNPGFATWGIYNQFRASLESLKVQGDNSATTPRPATAPPADTRPDEATAETRKNLEALAASVPYPEIADSLRQLAVTPPALEDLEAELSSLETQMIEKARKSQTEEQRLESLKTLDGQLRPYRERMTKAQLQALQAQFERKNLTDQAHLPRLSMFYW